MTLWCLTCSEYLTQRDEIARRGLIWKHVGNDWSNGIDRDDLYGECGPVVPVFLRGVALAIWNGWYWVTHLA